MSGVDWASAPATFDGGGVGGGGGGGGGAWDEEGPDWPSAAAALGASLSSAMEKPKSEAPIKEASEAAMDSQVGTSGAPEDDGPAGTAEEGSKAGPAAHCIASDVGKTDVQ